MAAIKNKQRAYKWIKRLGLVAILGIASVFVLVSVYVYLNLRTLPKVNVQQLTTHETTRILDSEGKAIWQPTDKRIGVMEYDQIPELYRDGLIAVEDNDYWTNKGYSNKGIANMVFSVIYSKINPNATARGGSTLEQQLIKNVYFNGGQGIKTTTRKIQELYLARQINTNFNKKEIFALYVNHLSYAEGDTGVSAIMKTYFGKTPDQYKEKSIENIAQQAYLIGLGQNPTMYNLYTNPKDANERKNTVLSVLKEKQLITSDEYQQAKDYDLQTGLKPRYWESEEQYAMNLKYKAYTDRVKSDVEQMGYNLNDVSLTIHTYMNQGTYDQITNTVRQEQYFQDSDNVEVPEQVGVAVVDTQGIVQGLVGSRFDGDEVNRALQRTRSSGSSTKPFTAYGPLLQYMGDQYNTASTFNSNSYQYPGTNFYMNNWGNYNYGNVSIQRALRLSLNGVVARIDDEVLGSTRMKTFLNGVGLDNQDTYSAIDGIGLYVSPLDAAAAYNAINNKGMYIEPRLISSIDFSDGSSKQIKPKEHRVMNESTAFVLAQMLRGTMMQGFTAPDAAISQYSGYAAKTGTVGLDDNSPSPNIYGAGGSDSWFDSITNNGYAIAIWFGYDKPNESPQVADNFKGPQHLGRDLQHMLNGDKDIPNWEKPDTVNLIGGSGLNADYAITDSKDISNDTLVIPPINPIYNQLNDIDTYKSESNVPNNWKKSITGNDKEFYNQYKNNPSILDDTTIIQSSLYNILEGGR